MLLYFLYILSHHIRIIQVSCQSSSCLFFFIRNLFFLLFWTPFKILYEFTRVNKWRFFLYTHALWWCIHIFISKEYSWIPLKLLYMSSFYNFTNNRQTTSLRKASLFYAYPWPSFIVVYNLFLSCLSGIRLRVEKMRICISIPEMTRKDRKNGLIIILISSKQEVIWMDEWRL